MSLKHLGICTQVGGSGSPGSPHPGCTRSNPWCDTYTNPPICKCGTVNTDVAGTVPNVFCTELNPICVTTNPALPVCKCDADTNKVCDTTSSICQIVDDGTNQCRCGGDSTGTASRVDPCTTDRVLPSCLCNNKHEIGATSAMCSNCRNSNGNAGDGSEKGTCVDQKICYDDGSCRGTVA